MRLCMGSVVPCPAGRLGQLLTAVQSSCGSAISAVSLTTSLGSAQPLQSRSPVNGQYKRASRAKEVLTRRMVSSVCHCTRSAAAEEHLLSGVVCTTPRR